MEGKDARDGPLDEEGVRLRAGSPNFARLQSFTLAGPGMRQKGAEALAASPYLDRLECLRVNQNAIPPAGQDALRERFGGRVFFS